MERTWYVFFFDVNGKKWAKADYVLNCINLAETVRGYGECLTALNARATKKDAFETATIWNQKYIEQGIYKWM